MARLMRLTFTSATLSAWTEDVMGLAFECCGVAARFWQAVKGLIAS